MCLFGTMHCNFAFCVLICKPFLVMPLLFLHH
uniref:Uncharacterized protein n=1 Tax=Rhizophora mucronata TaxID=61149 RepID=A0A2P2NH82_RHIMU